MYPVKVYSGHNGRPSQNKIISKVGEIIKILIKKWKNSKDLQTKPWNPQEVLLWDGHSTFSLAASLWKSVKFGDFKIIALIKTN